MASDQHQTDTAGVRAHASDLDAAPDLRANPNLDFAADLEGAARDIHPFDPIAAQGPRTSRSRG